MLIPRNTWPDKVAYDEAANRIADMLHDNFAKYADGVSEGISNAGPVPARALTAEG